MGLSSKPPLSSQNRQSRLTTLPKLKFKRNSSSAHLGWFETHIKDKKKFEEVLAAHRTRLINTPSITSHFNQSTLIKLCSIETPEAVSLLIHHLSINSPGLQNDFEEYCLTNDDLKPLVVTSKRNRCISSLPTRTPSLSFRPSRLSLMSNSTSIRYGESTTHVETPALARSTVDVSTLNNPPTTTCLPPPLGDPSRHLTYTSHKQAITLTAPLSTLGSIRPDERVEIMIDVKEDCLARKDTKLYFNLLGTCAICEYQIQWNAIFSTQFQVRESASSIFSLIQPPGIEHDQAETYRLLASFHVPQPMGCFCRRPEEDLLAAKMPPTGDSGSFQFLLDITGEVHTPKVKCRKSSSGKYTAKIPITTTRITRGKRVTSYIPSCINNRSAEISVMFSWKIDPPLKRARYMMLISTTHPFPNSAGALRKLGKMIQVSLVWKRLEPGRSMVQVKALQKGRHKQIVTLALGPDSETTVQVDGSISLVHKSRAPRKATLGSGWYGVQVNSPVENDEEVLFSMDLQD